MLSGLKSIIIVPLLFLPSVYAQADKKLTEAQLIDSFGKSTGEERSARFDNFFIQLSNDPAAIGYVFIFCGKSCRYGEVEGHMRGIELIIEGRRLDRARIIVVHGGFRDNQEVELWLKPKDASAPSPNSTRNIKDVIFKRANNRIIEPYDCCDEIQEQWKAFRPKISVQ